MEEKFQIRINLPAKGKRIGEKIVRVTQKSGQANENEVVRQRRTSSVDHFQELTQSGPIEYQNMNRLPNEYFVYAALIVSILILFLPHEDNSNSPNRMIEISVNLKLVVSTT